MKRVSLAIASLLPLSAAGYEVGTHALATKVAYDQSVLSPTHPKSIVTALLLDREDVVAPFRMEGVSLPDRYLDILTCRLSSDEELVEDSSCGWG